MKKKELPFAKALSAYQFPYIAMMTILCIFFLTLYAYYSQLAQENKKNEGEKIVQDIKNDFSSNKTLQQAVKVELKDETIKITLPNSIVFDLGSDKLRAVIIPSLLKLSKSLRALPENYKVAIEGHTDDSPVWYGGDFASNLELSLYRSLSLIDIFVEGGTSSDKFVAAGYSEYMPLFSNDTPENKAANRRVEIILRKKNKADMKLNTPKVKKIPVRDI